MAMTLGSSGTIQVGGSAVAYVKNASFSIQNEMVDSTDMDSSDNWRTFLAGARSGTFSFTANAGALYGGTPDDAEQKAIADEIVESGGADALSWVYFPAGTTTNYYKYSFSGYVEEWSHGMANNEVVEINVTVRITGAITLAAAT